MVQERTDGRARRGTPQLLGVESARDGSDTGVVFHGESTAGIAVEGVLGRQSCDGEALPALARERRSARAR